MKTLLISALLVLAAPALPADPTPIEASIASPERTDKDRERDAREKPAEVLAFAGVKPGMTVVDMFAGSGYYTELLAGVVGPTGKVLSVNNVPYAQYGKDGIKVGTEQKFTSNCLDGSRDPQSPETAREGHPVAGPGRANDRWLR